MAITTNLIQASLQQKSNFFTLDLVEWKTCFSGPKNVFHRQTDRSDYFLPAETRPTDDDTSTIEKAGPVCR